MPGIQYKIETAADLKALRATEAALRQQIIQAQVAGKEFAALQKQLQVVTATIRSIPAPKRIGLEMADMVQGLPIIGNLASAINGLGGPITFATGALAGLFQTTAKSISAFAEAETKMAKLDAVLAQAGQLTDAYRARLQGLASQLQATTSIADDQWLDVLSRLTQFGADPSNIEDYAEAVKNLAGITGGDVVSAAELFSKAMAGQFDALSRLGIVVEKSGSQTQRLQSLMEQLAEKGGGVLEARSRTLAGQWANLTHSAGDLLEAIGNLIARTGIFQGTIALLNGGLNILQSLFPSLIPRTEGLNNQFQTSGQRAEAFRQSLSDLGESGDKALAQFGAAGEALDALNRRLAEAAERSAATRQSMLDMADATAEAAAAQVKISLAKGEITQEQAAERLRDIERSKSEDKLAIARQEQEEILRANQERLDTLAAQENKAAAEAAAAEKKAADVRAAMNQAGIRSDQDITIAAATAPRKPGERGPARRPSREAIETARKEKESGLETYSNAESQLDQKIREANARIAANANPPRRESASGKTARLQRLAEARAELQSLQQTKALITQNAAAQSEIEEKRRAAIAAEELRKRESPAAEAAAAQAQKKLEVLSIQQSTTTTSGQAEDLQAQAAERAAAAEADHKRRILDLTIAASEARARGDEEAAAAAERTMRWLQEYKRVWDETSDDALARRAANAATTQLDAANPTSPSSPTSRAAAAFQADRLAQIGGFVGAASSDRAIRPIEQTAANTARIAKATERFASTSSQTIATAATF